MSTTGAAPDSDEAAEHVIGPVAANRHRSIYRVVERRGEQLLLLRLVGVLLRPGVVQRRDQVLPGDTWMSAEPFAPFDLTSAAQVEPEIIFGPVPEGTQWQVLACQRPARITSSPSTTTT